MSELPPAGPLTQSALVSVDEGVAATLRAFDAADAELRRELERVVRIVALDPDSTRRYREEQIRRLLTRIGEIRADLIGQSAIFAEESLARVYAGGMTRAEAIRRAGGRIAAGQPSFTLIHRQAVEVLAIQSFSDLAAATDYIDTAARRVIREATKTRTIVQAATGSGVDRSSRALVRELTTRGVTGFVDAAGRNWRLNSYASMVIRTKSAEAFNYGTVLRTEETGTRALEIFDGIPSDHRPCREKNGRTADPGWALANPIEHPNCVRSFGPLPLFTGTTDYGTGTSAADAVRSAREAETMPDRLDVRFP